MWSHTVLEIYTHVVHDGEGIVEWPDEGTPADWIELGLVGYCQGEAEDLLALTPFWKLLWWKLKSWNERLRWALELD